MRAAAHHMVRFMTAGMALITCREPLLISISNNLRSNFLAALRVSAATLTCIMRGVPFYARQKACTQGGDGTCFSHLGIPVSRSPLACGFLQVYRLDVVSTVF